MGCAMRSSSPQVVVVGAGIGGLAIALRLAAAGLDVTVLERARHVGGKMRTIQVADRELDGGPTVLTMREVFDELFAVVGANFEERVPLKRASVVARHAWPDSTCLDLHAEFEASADAIGRFAGASDARGFREFCAYARRLYEIVEQPFLRSERPSISRALRGEGGVPLSSFLGIDAHRTMWSALGDFFRDPRLRQLFARYATYCGSSPFEAPATLNVIAHVERRGVHYVEGGMARLARELARLVEESGAVIELGAHVSRIAPETGGERRLRLWVEGTESRTADLVVLNADAAALAAGLFGDAATRGASLPRTRSLSAITWARVARVEGMSLVRHNVFFSRDYNAEFEALFGRSGSSRRRVAPRMPDEPTVYVCAQDRRDGALTGCEAERIFCLVNAPAAGDSRPIAEREVRTCLERMTMLLGRSGLHLIDEAQPVVTTPTDFEKLFPGTGGALYGPATHGLTAPMQRPSARTRVPSLYLVGGSSHPGAGVPMVALSAKMCAAAILQDLDSMSKSRATAMPGSTSTSSATTRASG